MLINNTKKNIKKIKFSQVIATLILFFSLFALNFTAVSVSASRSIFLPSEYIYYSPEKANSKLYKEEDLKISIKNFEDAGNGDKCKFLFFKYGKEAAGTVYEKESSYQNGVCEQVLKVDEQTYQGWSISVLVETAKGVFRNDTSYLFKSGPIGVVSLT
jgi:hypothetical protein